MTSGDTNVIDACVDGSKGHPEDERLVLFRGNKNNSSDPRLNPQCTTTSEMPDGMSEDKVASSAMTFLSNDRKAPWRAQLEDSLKHHARIVGVHMRRIQHVNKMALLGAWALVLSWNGSLSAQTVEQGPKLEEVIVTAQRRSEDLQAVPIGMDAITGDTMEKLGDKNLFDYASTVPDLSLGIGSGNGASGFGYGVSSSRSITIRGVAGNNTTGLYLNDTPVPLSVDPRVIDMDRVEVLRGPQGTLFGAGSMGGTIRIFTREPSLDQTSGKV